MAKEFNYRDYLKNNPLLNEAQGDNDESDDSLGAKNGKKKQDMKQRRADSENMEKAKGKRKYSGDQSKDKVDELYDDMGEEMDMNKKKISVKEFNLEPELEVILRGEPFHIDIDLRVRAQLRAAAARRQPALPARPHAGDAHVRRGGDGSAA